VNTAEIEFFLAKLYTDEALLKRFVENPSNELAKHQLSRETIDSLLQLDAQDLMLAAHSYSHKRSQYWHGHAGWIKSWRKIFSW